MQRYSFSPEVRPTHLALTALQTSALSAFGEEFQCDSTIMNDNRRHDCVQKDIAFKIVLNVVVEGGRVNRVR